MKFQIARSYVDVEVDRRDAAHLQCDATAKALAKQLAARFGLPTVIGTCRLMYGNEIELMVYLDDEKRPVLAGHDPRSVSRCAVTMEISLRRPVVTEEVAHFGEASRSEQPPWLVGLGLGDLSNVAQPWIDWLCEERGLTYVPVEGLGKKCLIT